MDNKQLLRNRIITALKEQGFTINPHVHPRGCSKATFRRVQRKATLEKIAQHKSFLTEHLDLAKQYCRDGKEITPEGIQLHLREVKSDSLDATLARWWNFIWWSIPYQPTYGRRMRFLLWDTTHNAPFGLICLQSPVLKLSVRDNSLGMPKDQLDIWVNRSMSAQRVGAFPPYNQLLGGKMVALSLISNEIRQAYRNKYRNYVSIIKRRKLNADLLFITTTGAFGKSSLYNRLKYDGEPVAECLGYTQGSGSFHIPENLYQEIVLFLSNLGVDVARGYGHGPSRKLRLISRGFQHLGLPSFEYHGIKRGVYLFPLAKNLRGVIQHSEEPVWVERPFPDLAAYWKRRWALPRAERLPQWKEFRKATFFSKARMMLEEL